MSESPTVKPDEKKAALEEVLKSSSFVRSDQLRSFLKYVCQMELAGRGDELNEYLIGVEALGKPPGYSTAEDAAVRRRAHELREKLEEAYTTDLAGARLRIELPKGRYVPRYVPREPEGPPPPPAVAASPRPARWLAPLAFMILGAVLALAGMRVLRRPPAPAVEPVLAEAWGALAAPGSNVTIAVASPAHFNILPYPDGGPLPPGVRLVPADWDLTTWYQNHYPLPPGHRLGMHLSGPLRSGEVLGMLTAVRLLTRAHAEVQVIVEKKLPLSAVRGRNLILFANPEYSELANALLARGIWTVGYDPSGRARVIRPHETGSTHKTFAPGAEWQRRATFGLLTVLPNAESVVPGQAPSATPSRAVLVSCTNSQGCQAAMDFFASPDSMSALRERFRAEGRPGFPPAYQVVVRCDLHLSQPVAGAYEAHAVVTPR